MGSGFTIDGVPFSLTIGRVIPGLPRQRIVRADTGAHISLAYPDGDGFLFDDRMAGYRLNADGTVKRFQTKGAYYQARKDAGWPLRKRRARA